MTTNRKIKLKKGFGENRKQVRARVFSKLLNMSEFNWKEIQINTCSDEGKEFISISSEKHITESNPVEMFFELDSVPSLIATLQTALNVANEDIAQKQIDWELNEHNNI